MSKKLLILSATFVFLLASVFAFGVSSPYWEGNDLMMAAGETRVVNLNLQNMVGDKDVFVVVEVNKGSDIASISKNSYNVPIQTTLDLPVTISIPRDVEQGTNYEVGVYVKLAGDADGMVALGTGMQTSFKVIVDGIAKPDYTWVYILVGVVVLIIMGWLVLSKNKKKAKKEISLNSKKEIRASVKNAKKSVKKNSKKKTAKKK